MFLMIRNKGVADWRGFTTLGVSTTRYAGHAGTIGQFGSGSKLSIALLLRMGIRPTIFCGNLRMDFFSKPELVQGQQFNRVCVKFAGKDLEGVSKTSQDDLGFTLEWGVQDWTKPSMAFREFVSNAIDGSITSGLTHKDVEFEVVEKPRAKAGHTSVFIPYTPEVEAIYRELPKLFLHFGEDSQLDQKLLPKRDPDSGKTYIYKKGVLVSYLPGNSVFDYNLGDELTLDESRNAHEWDVRYAVSLALKDASAANLATVIKCVGEGRDVMEAKLDSSYLMQTYETNAERRKKRELAFATAFRAIAGEKGVVTSGSPALSSFVEAKGFKSFTMPNNWMAALGAYGVPTETVVLTSSEKEGKVISEATADMVASVDWVWELLETFALTNGKAKPPVKGFKTIMDGGAQTRGYYLDGTVYLHTDLSASRLLNKVALEEVVHHVTGAGDGSRDIQDFLFRAIIEMAM